MVCIGAVDDKKKCELDVAQAKCKQVQNPCRWARRAEDGENEARIIARNPDLAFGGEAGRSAAAAQVFYASSLLSEC